MIRAVYAGDKNFSSSEAVSGQVVNKAPSTTVVVSPANPTQAGATATFNVTLSAQYGGTPTGTVSFADGNTVLAASQPVTAGTATFSTTGLSNGVHTIHATYNGDGNFLSSSDGVFQVVNPLTETATTVSLTIAPTPALFRKQIKLTAALTSATVGTPTGFVYFVDDDTVLNNGNSVAVTTAGCPNGVKACAILTLKGYKVGARRIVAVYTGDGTFGGGVSDSSLPSAILNRSPKPR